MSRRGRNDIFDTPASKKRGQRQRADTPPPQQEHAPQQRLPRKAVGAFSIDHTGRVRPIADKQPQRRHWARVPGISAETGLIYPSWEAAHAAQDKE
jgi:hypothetical protein